MGVFRPDHFLGDLHMLTGQGVPLSAVVREGGELLAIPREQLKVVVAEEPDLSDIILKTFLARRSYIMRTGVGLRIVGSRHSRCDGPEGVRGPQPAAPRFDRARGEP